MTCRELAEFIAEYLDGELPDEVRTSFERHLSRCVNCRSYLTAYKTAIELGRRTLKADESELPANVPLELVEGILAARRR